MQNRRDGRVVRDHTVAASRASLPVPPAAHGMRPLDGARERSHLAGWPSWPFWPRLAGLSCCGRSWKGQIALKSTPGNLQPDPPRGPAGGTDRRRGLDSRRPDSDSQTDTRSKDPGLLALRRHPDMPSHPPASHPNTALRYCTCHIRSPGGMPWMYIVLCHTLAVTPSPRAAHPHARTHTHTLAHTRTPSLHRFRVPPAAQRPRQRRVWSAIPPHSHLPEGPLSQENISVLTHPCPGPQENAPWPALDVRPAPARGVPPCPGEPLLDFFSQE